MQRISGVYMPVSGRAFSVNLRAWHAHMNSNEIRSVGLRRGGVTLEHNMACRYSVMQLLKTVADVPRRRFEGSRSGQMAEGQGDRRGHGGHPDLSE